MDSHNAVTSSEPASVPVDHQDPNHPYYPRDLEHQSGARRSVLTKKRVLIAGGVVTTIIVIIAAVIWGVALTRKNDDKGADASATTVTTNATTSAPFKIQNVSVNTTTVVYSTTRVPLLVAPSLATSTIVLAIPRTPHAPLRPIAAATLFATPMPSTLVPSEVPVGDISITGCFFNGAWPLEEQYEKHCPAWDDHETHCEVSKRSQWVCVS